MSFMEGSDNGPVVEGQPASPESQPETPTYSPFAQNYLNGVPEEERELVGKHIQEWDKGFTRYAQPLQRELKSYKDLGTDPETLKTAHGVYRRILDDPQGVAEYLHDQGYVVNRQGQVVDAQTGQQAPASVQSAVQGQNGSPDITSHPEFQKLSSNAQRMERALGLMAEQMTQRQQQEAAQQADNELQTYLSDFKKSHGNVPEQFILAYLNANVVDPQEIAAQWKNVVQQELNQRERSTPPNLLGGGSSPPIAQNTANMTGDQRREALLKSLNF